MILFLQKIYDKRDDFDFEIVNFPFLDGDVPRSTSYGVYISQLIPFARASSYVADFNTRNKLLTQKLLKQSYRYHKLRKSFSKIFILGQVWYLIVSIPDLCTLSYFTHSPPFMTIVICSVIVAYIANNMVLRNIRVHSVCFLYKISQECILIHAADVINRQHYMAINYW